MTQHTTGPWESRPIGSKGNLGIFRIAKCFIACSLYDVITDSR